MILFIVFLLNIFIYSLPQLLLNSCILECVKKKSQLSTLKMSLIVCNKELRGTGALTKNVKTCLNRLKDYMNTALLDIFIRKSRKIKNQP